jgi:hypothetical protein
VRRAPDREGVLRRDLYRWTPENGAVVRLTELADLAEADPAPDGRSAAGVRVRYGVSELVRVDLKSGDVRPIAIDGDGEDPWRVWSHPRVSPDGSSIAVLLHSGGRWRLVIVPFAGGAVTGIAVPGSPAGAPAWSADGSRIFVAADRGGIWNLESVTARGNASGAEMLTRVTGGALDPAPEPGGEALFFLEVTSKGVDVQRLPMPAPPLEPLARRPESFPLLPPESPAAAPFTRAAVAPDRPYRIGPSHVVRPLATYSVGPDGNAWQLGVEGSDVVGRLDWIALGSIGNEAGPRGASLAGAWRGLPIALSAHLFAAREKPGSQRVVRRPELDQERFGAFVEGSWSRPVSGGRVRVDAGGGVSRVEPLEGGDSFDRSVVALHGRGSAARVRGKTGLGVEAELSATNGWTAGASWRQVLAGGGLSAFLPPARISLFGRYGDTSGSPTRFDVFSVGGAGSSILPAGLDRNRIELAALPAFVQTGERVESLRAELALRALPLVFYGDRLRAWTPGGEKPRPVRVFGAEIRIDERLLPISFSGDVAFYAGVAKIRSTTPRFDSTRGYAGLLYRP